MLLRWTCIAGLLLTAARAQAMTPLQVLQKAAARAVADDAAQQAYAWHVRQVISTVGPPGKPAHVRSDETDDVSEVDGVEYDQLVARNGKPLPPADQAREDRKLAAFIRKHSTAQGRAADLAQQQKNRQKRQAIIRAIPTAFQLTFAPPAAPPVCDCYVVSLAPLAGYHPSSRDLALLHHVAGQLWIDRASFGVVKMRVRFLHTVAIGWVLARIGSGSTITSQSALVDGHWFGARMTAALNVRLLLVKNYRLQVSDTYSDYRQFEGRARLINISHP